MSETYLENTHKEIQVESWSNSARTLLLKGFTDGGPFEEEHTTSSTRALATSTHQLHGMPLGITVSASAAGVRRGECYVRVSLMIDGKPVQRLIAAYLTDGKTLSWPPGVHEGFTDGAGLIRVITGTNPAANVEISEAVPTNARWRLQSILAYLVVDATVINRVIRFTLDDGTTVFWQTRPHDNQQASEGRTYLMAPNHEYHATEDALDFNRQPIPEFLLFQGYQIKTVTDNMQAADNWGPPMLVVEEWIEE